MACCRPSTIVPRKPLDPSRNYFAATGEAAPGTTGGQVFAKSAVLGSVPFKITSPGLDFDQFSLSATGSTGGCTSVGAAWPAVAGLFFLLRRRRRA